MASTSRCPACGVRIAGRPAACPGCGARLKARAPRPDEDADGDRPRKKKRRKKAGPNYALLAAAGGGFVILAAVAVLVAMALDRTSRKDDPTGPPVANVGPGQPGGPGVGEAAPKWTAKADPPKAPIRPKDDLSIAIRGEPLFASGQAPFVADLASAVANPNAPELAVYDLRTGERALSAKAVNWNLPTIGGNPALDPLIALGPDGKTLAVRAIKETSVGRSRSTLTEAVVYRLDKDGPPIRITLRNWIPWMAFGRDEDQLVALSVMPGGGFAAATYDINKPDAEPIHLQIPTTPIRWRNAFGSREALAVSPGRNYLAVGEGRAVDLIQLSDGQPAGRFDLPGDCLTVAFSADGQELAVHSRIPPPPRSRNIPAEYQWTTFSLADGKKKSAQQVKGGPHPGVILAAGPKPGLAVHADREKGVVTVMDARVGAPAFTTPLDAVRSFDSDRLLGYDKNAKHVVVRRIDAEKLAAGEKELAALFGPRPEAVAADRAGLARPTAPTGWAVPIDAGPAERPALAPRHTVAGGADFVMPWPGGSTLSALTIQRVETPRDRYPLQWVRVDLAAGKAESPTDLWPSLMPPGEVPPPAGSGELVADHSADGSRLAVRDAATPARVDVWDRSGKRLLGFLPYGPETPVEAVAWAGPNRLITRGGGKVTGWEVPGPKAVYEFMGYAGAHALSPSRQWIMLQADKHLDVFDTATGKPLGRAEQANPGGKPWHGFAFAADGLQLAAIEQVRAGGGNVPGVWAVATWDLRTGQPKDAQRLFGGYAARPAHPVQWLAPRLLLAGGSDVIDLDARAVTATLGLSPDQPLPSPDGRYWGARADKSGPNPNIRNPVETIIATDLAEPVKAVPRLRPDDVVLRDGTTVEVVSNTGDNGRDAVVRSQLGQKLGAEGFGTGRGGWRLVVTAQQTAGSGSSLETPSGGKIRIPGISGKVQLQDPSGEVAWEVPASGGWDMYKTRYRTGKEQVVGPMGYSITHYNFGLRDPVAAMAEEAWDNFLEGMQMMTGFPRMIARVNGKLVRLPIAVPVAAK